MQWISPTVPSNFPSLAHSTLRSATSTIDYIRWTSPLWYGRYWTRTTLTSWAECRCHRSTSNLSKTAFISSSEKFGRWLNNTNEAYTSLHSDYGSFIKTFKINIVLQFIGIADTAPMIDETDMRERMIFRTGHLSNNKYHQTIVPNLV